MKGNPETECMVGTHNLNQSKIGYILGLCDLGMISLERASFDFSLPVGGWERWRSAFCFQIQLSTVESEKPSFLWEAQKQQTIRNQRVMETHNGVKTSCDKIFFKVSETLTSVFSLGLAEVWPSGKTASAKSGGSFWDFQTTSSLQS